MHTKYFIPLLLLLFCGSLNAQNIATDRPNQTESSLVIPKGSFQIESGFLVGYSGEDDQYSRQVLSPITFFRYGISKSVEIRLMNQVESVKQQDVLRQGFSDLQIGTKIQLLKKENINTEIAFLTSLILPTGNKELSQDHIGSVSKIAIAHQLSNNLSLSYNLGYAYIDQNEDFVTYSLSFGIGINDKLGLYIEPYGSLIDEDHIENSFDTGFTYLVKPNFQLDFSFGSGIDYSMNYLALGASWRVDP